MNMREIKKNMKPNENPRNDKERNARKTPKNMMEIRKTGERMRTRESTKN